jgi:glutamate-1-semialdehyde 2,1-aminomutase
MEKIQKIVIDRQIVSQDQFVFYLFHFLFLQETISRGLLMPYVVPSFAHKQEDINFAIDCVREALIVMKEAAEGSGMVSAIKGGIVKPVFRKFN